MEAHLPFRLTDPVTEAAEVDARFEIETGRVFIRQMTDLERAKYPVIHPTRTDLRECVSRRLTLEEIADKYEITVKRAQRLASIYNLAHRLEVRRSA